MVRAPIPGTRACDVGGRLTIRLTPSADLNCSVRCQARIQHIRVDYSGNRRPKRECSRVCERVGPYPLRLLLAARTPSHA